MPRISLLGLTVLAAGCLQPDDGIVVVDERFEDCVACRWSVEGSIEQVTTVHPGEHGLRFAGSTTMTLPISVTIWDDFSDGHWLEYSTSCGGAPEIWTAPGATGWHVFARIPMIAEGEPAGFERRYGNLPPIPRAEYTSVALTALTLVVDDPQGKCALDNLRLVQPEPQDGW